MGVDASPQRRAWTITVRDDWGNVVDSWKFFGTRSQANAQADSVDIVEGYTAKGTPRGRA